MAIRWFPKPVKPTKWHWHCCSMLFYLVYPLIHCWITMADCCVGSLGVMSSDPGRALKDGSKNLGGENFIAAWRQNHEAFMFKHEGQSFTSLNAGFNFVRPPVSLLTQSIQTSSHSVSESKDSCRQGQHISHQRLLYHGQNYRMMIRLFPTKYKQQGV